MDMKKLIDDTDFDNLNQLSKRWKKDGNNNSSLVDSKASSVHTETVSKPKHSQTQPAFKENMQKSSNISPNRESKDESTVVMDMPKRKREVMPQVFD